MTGMHNVEARNWIVDNVSKSPKRKVSSLWTLRTTSVLWNPILRVLGNGQHFGTSEHDSHVKQISDRRSLITALFCESRIIFRIRMILLRVRESRSWHRGRYHQNRTFYSSTWLWAQHLTARGNIDRRFTEHEYGEWCEYTILCDTRDLSSTSICHHRTRAIQPRNWGVILLTPTA